ncbi:hypothetical protein [Bosea sp. (in: a-proteobacteria)]|uniref:hypothetical protein n=1 Tax=Bosea sp. (in: a-proteobacteria) TaxID=1871050 RepID=UPI0027335F44|nr:hypothetical protein [Bosea sp. (in: a-proteobacteria)]MDP3408061.1 hypothetical protein [Bosea sp. (in: a-proteobacteria)]
MPWVKHETYSIDDDVNVIPDPVFAYQLAESHGYDACVERWSWMKEARIGRLIQKGRRIVQGRAARAATGAALSDMQTLDAKIVRVTEEIGNVETAIAELGVSRERIMAAFDRLDRKPPSARKRPSEAALRDAFARGLSAEATGRELGCGAPTVRIAWDRLGLDLKARKRAIRIQKAAAEMAISVDAAAGIRLPEVTVNDVIADMAEGLGLAAIARKRGVPVHRITRICRIHRIPGAHSHA